ncbi:hypothetical protein [Mycobacterium sp. GA-2829]|uniref:hypothetical protein n=1 Tax=Mycobacterium sp. GA-2829 TaxID=1772283 RepID=UPI000A4D5382|nr:hypothetical protein [Mycobacterium sp. GA-2829]
MSVGPRPRFAWFDVRLVIAIALTAVAYGHSYAATLADAVAGGRTPVLVVLPALVVLIAASHRTPPRGVGDTESNWIIAAMVAAPALAGFELLSSRLPTLSTLWHLQDFGAVVWFAALLAVLFGVRHVARMWPLWIFAVYFVSPLPSILTTAVLGGSDTAAVMPAVWAGALAVFLACPAVPMVRRTTAAAGCLAVAAVVALIAAPQLPLMATALVVGAALPVAVTIVNRRTAAPAGTPAWSAPHPVSARSVATLAALGAVLAVLNPSTVLPAPLPTVETDWTEKAGLTAAASYDFITRYAGPDATFVRYRPAAVDGLPALAVDVITTSARAPLTAIGDLTWYPAATPVNFLPAPGDWGLPAGARIAHTNADAARVGNTGEWLAIAWEWQSGDVFQRVTVLANQSPTDGRLPVPAPVKLLDVSLRPALWVARQQPDELGDVDDVVLQDAVALAAEVAAADA